MDFGRELPTLDAEDDGVGGLGRGLTPVVLVDEVAGGADEGSLSDGVAGSEHGEGG